MLIGAAQSACFLAKFWLPLSALFFIGVSMVEREDADALSNQLANLKVTAAEKACVFQLKESDINRSEKKLVNAVLCKIFTNKKIVPEIFQSKMPKIWSQEHTIIDHVGFNLFLCKFRNTRIKKTNS